jgi:ribosomal protein L32
MFISVQFVSIQLVRQGHDKTGAEKTSICSWSGNPKQLHTLCSEGAAAAI